MASALLAGGCVTPAIQPAMTPPPDFAGPALGEPVDGLGTVVADDGATLAYRVWRPANREPWAVVVALHGMNDYSAAWRLAGPAWAERGIATYAYDQRGFGRSPGPGVWAGEARMVQDLRIVIAQVRARHPNAILAVAGESMGGAVAIAAFASDDPPDADRLILMAPAVWGWSSQAPLNRAGLWLTARLMGERSARPPDWAVRDIRATDNMLQLARNAADPLFIVRTRFDTLSGLVDLMESATRGLGRTGVPTLMMYGAHDDIIRPGPTARALSRAGDPPNLRTAWYADGYHLLNRDLGSGTVTADVEAYLRDADATLPSGAVPIAEGLERLRRERSRRPDR